MVAYMYIRNSKKRLTEAFAVHTNSVEDFVHVEKSVLHYLEIFLPVKLKTIEFILLLF